MATGALADLHPRLQNPDSSQDLILASRKNARVNSRARCAIDDLAHVVLSYVRDLANRLGLRDWTLILTQETPQPGRIAEIAPVWGRKHAALRLSGEFFDRDGAAQRHTVVHELLHCQFATAQLYAQRVMVPHSYLALELNFECGIDGVADAIAPLFPLPAW
jgi:hypothetical protein